MLLIISCGIILAKCLKKCNGDIRLKVFAERGKDIIQDYFHSFSFALAQKKKLHAFCSMPNMGYIVVCGYRFWY